MTHREMRRVGPGLLRTIVLRSYPSPEYDSAGYNVAGCVY